MTKPNALLTPKAIRTCSAASFLNLLLAISIGTVSAQSAEWAVFENIGSFGSSVVDRHHHVWMAGSRLAVFDGTSWEYFDQSNAPLPNGSFTDLAIDNNGHVWIGVANEHIGGGLIRITRARPRIDEEDWTVLFRNSYVYSVAADSVGRVWQASLEPKSGHPNPLLMFDGAGWIESSLLSDTLFYVSDLAPGRDETVWALLWNFDGQGAETVYYHHLFRLSGEEWTYAGPLPLSEAGRVTEIAVDGASNLWIGTHGHGIVRYDGTGFVTITASNSPLPSDSITALAVEQNNTLWIGTANGLASLDQAGWEVFDRDNSELPYNEVTTVSVDSNGNKWIGTSNGSVSGFRRGGLVPVANAKSPESPAPESLLTIYPNPFRATTIIRYSLPSPQHVNVRVHDSLGREIAVLVDTWLPRGQHEVMFDAAKLPSGRYHIQVITDHRSQSVQAILLK